MRSLVNLILGASLLGCVPKAGFVRQGENPFADGAVVFEGNFRILMMVPKTYRKEAQFGRARHTYDESISARLLSDFTLRFISSDNNIIVCSVAEHFACVLPIGRYEYFQIERAAAFGYYFQWFRITNHGSAPGSVNYLGDITVEVYREISQLGVKLTAHMDTFTAEESRPAANEIRERPVVVTQPMLRRTIVDGSTVNSERTDYQVFSKTGVFYDIREQSDIEREDRLKIYPANTRFVYTPVEVWSRPCFKPGLTDTKSPNCGLGFLKMAFKDKSMNERFE
ncbi:MAG: hypothetical protein KF713_09375 [Turneriella sp.]|nr:hypothetical protein [Turneriella sp.]